MKLLTILLMTMSLTSFADQSKEPNDCDALNVMNAMFPEHRDTAQNQQVIATVIQAYQKKCKDLSEKLAKESKKK